MNNMKRITIILLFVSLWIGFTACQQDMTSDDELSTGDGALRLERLAIQEESDIPVIQTKGSFGLDAGKFPIELWQRNNEDLTLYKSFISYTAMIEQGMPLVLPVGSYEVRATSYLKEAGVKVNSTPWFEGKQEVVIEEKTVTSVPTLHCTFQSVGVELRLSDQFKAKLLAEPLNYDYSLTVSTSEASASFNTEAVPAAVYFEDSAEKLTVKVIIKLDGVTYPERTYYISNPDKQIVSVGEYYIINLDAGVTSETKTIGLSAQCLGGNKL